jgi:hypothetical protein
MGKQALGVRQQALVKKQDKSKNKPFTFAQLRKSATVTAALSPFENSQNIEMNEALRCSLSKMNEPQGPGLRGIR